jgi:hypothetical protein
LEFGFFVWVPIAKEKLRGTIARAAADAAVPMNLRLETVEFFILIRFWN